MKKQNIMFAALLSLTMMTSVVHAESAGITFDGDAAEFVQTTQETTTYVDMMPGEQRIQSITLTNQDYESMKFYVKIDDATLLNDEMDGNIVYDVAFKNDGETFYTGRIGGKSKVAKDNLTENYLLKTLEKGESTQIEMSIKLDGTSMDDSYQGSQGNFNIVFSVEHAEENKVLEIVKKIPLINKIPGVNTGDTTNLYLILGVAFISILAIIIILMKRRKVEDDEKA